MKPYRGARLLRLPNGITILLDSTTAEESGETFIIVGTKAGSAYDPLHALGLAHLFEHLSVTANPLSRNESRPAADVIECEASGAFNASTTHRTLDFYCSVEEDLDRVPFILETIYRGIAHSPFRKGILDRERLNIFSEIAIDNDDPSYYKMQLIKSKLFQNTPWEHPILGLRSTLDQIGIPDLTSFRRNYITPRSTVITIVGRFDFKKAIEAIQKTFGRMKISQHPPEYAPVSRHNKRCIGPFTEWGVEQCYLALGYRTRGIGSSTLPMRMLVNDLLFERYFSVLYHVVKSEIGGSYTPSAFDLTPPAEDDLIGGFEGVLSWSLDIIPEKTVPILNAIFRELATLHRKRLAQRLISKHADLLTEEHEVQLHKPKAIAWWLYNSYLTNAQYNFRTIADLFSAITPADVQRYIRRTVTNKFTVTGVVPYGWSDRLKTFFDNHGYI